VFADDDMGSAGGGAVEQHDAEAVESGDGHVLEQVPAVVTTSTWKPRCCAWSRTRPMVSTVLERSMADTIGSEGPFPEGCAAISRPVPPTG